MTGIAVDWPSNHSIRMAWIPISDWGLNDCADSFENQHNQIIEYIIVESRLSKTIPGYHILKDLHSI